MKGKDEDGAVKACTQAVEGDFMKGSELDTVTSRFLDVKCVSDVMYRDEGDGDEPPPDTRNFTMNAQYLPHMRAMVMTSNLCINFDGVGSVGIEDDEATCVVATSGVEGEPQDGGSVWAEAKAWAGWESSESSTPVDQFNDEVRRGGKQKAANEALCVVTAA